MFQIVFKNSVRANTCGQLRECGNSPGTGGLDLFMKLTIYLQGRGFLFCV